jgi:hypothetical protein
LSVGSQIPLAQIAVPTAPVQTPVSAGVWLATVGIAVPFPSRTTHVPALHHLPVPQSESTKHALEHAPVATLQ